MPLRAPLWVAVWRRKSLPTFILRKLKRDCCWSANSPLISSDSLPFMVSCRCTCQQNSFVCHSNWTQTMCLFSFDLDEKLAKTGWKRLIYFCRNFKWPDWGKETVMCPMKPFGHSKPPFCQNRLRVVSSKWCDSGQVWWSTAINMDDTSRQCRMQIHSWIMSRTWFPLQEATFLAIFWILFTDYLSSLMANGHLSQKNKQ